MPGALADRMSRLFGEDFERTGKLYESYDHDPGRGVMSPVLWN